MYLLKRYAELTIVSKRGRSPEEENERRSRPRHGSYVRVYSSPCRSQPRVVLMLPLQTFNMIGTTGNARVTNIAGDQHIYIDNGLGEETNNTLRSIEERLKVGQDQELGQSPLTCMILYSSHDTRL